MLAEAPFVMHARVFDETTVACTTLNYPARQDCLARRCGGSNFEVLSLDADKLFDYAE